MENAGNIVAGGLRGKDDIMKQPEILKQAEEMGKCVPKHKMLSNYGEHSCLSSKEGKYK